MVSRYVATAKSLASEDGFDVQEVRLETEEAKRVRMMQEKAAQRPLYDQLLEHQTKKQEEYDANARLLNAAPPKALDEDDAAFLNDEEQRKADRLRRKREIESDALDAFRLAQTQVGSGSAAGDRGGGGGVVLSVAKVKDSASSSGDAALNKQLPIIKIVKRKKADVDGDNDPQILNGKKREIETSSDNNNTTCNFNNNNINSNSNSDSNGKNDNYSNCSNKLQSLLGDYGSDSD